LASTFHEKVKPQGIYSFGVFRFYYYIGTTDDFNKRLEEHNNAVT
jgi:predicted GIY-YIG superfamily endonuclease